MRLGNNPNKNETITPLSRVVVVVITHLPSTTDYYHGGRYKVIKSSLFSLIANIHMPKSDYSLIVWDNGSCEEWTNELTDPGVFSPDVLILSRNIGKTNALKSIMRMLPPDTILAYGDDDIEYFPNWLAPQIQILETYPNVGTVTGWPVRITSTWGTESTMRWRWDNLDTELESGRFIPDEWERDYCDSVGRDWDAYAAGTWGVMDYRITYKGVSAYAMSQHAQFVCYPERVEHLIPWTDKAMSDEIEFDNAIDAAGMLRLATVERYTRHLGNVLERA